MDYSELIGRTITKVTIDDDRQGITFETDQGKRRYETEADCCSYTWIESIDDPAALLGTVRSVEDIPMPDRSPLDSIHRPDTDVVSFYGLKVVTEKGTVVIDYRNDSNGYYGGNLYYVDIKGKAQ